MNGLQYIQEQTMQNINQSVVICKELVYQAG